MSEPLKLLLVEDSEDDALLVLRALRKGGFAPTYARVETAPALQAALEHDEWDILIADHALPQFSAAEALAVLQTSPRDLPFVVVSGTIGEQLAVELMRTGASDYVMKGNLERLAAVVRREVREAAVRRERRRIDAALQSMIAGTAALTGSAFFNALVQQIAQALEVRYVLLNAVVDGHLHTLAHWGTAPLQPRPISTCEDSPTALVLREGLFTCSQDLAARFPSNPYICAWEAASYIGLALYASNQQAFGTLCILDTAPLRAPELTADLLRLFAARASAELERHQAIQALEQWNRDLEQIVAQRTAQLSAANSQLARANLELAHAARMKDEFLATMSHELRTPLNVILGLSESLKDAIYGPLAPRQSEMMDMIEQSGNHLLSLINDILDLSKISAGRLDLALEPNAVLFICENSLIFIKQQALRKNIQIRSQIPSEINELLINVDERRIRQALINLLANAVKFTPKGGSVLLLAQFSSDQANPSERWLSFQVLDTGIGIAAEQLDKLFEPFVQLDSNLNRHYEGTGLGLALVKQIAELHGGRVSVTSRLGHGSCFRFELPARVVVNIERLG